MKISFSTFTFVLCIVFFYSLLFVGCAPISVEEDCQVESEEDTFVVDSTDNELEKELTEIQEYAKFIDSIGVKKEQNEKEALRKLKLIQKKYVNSTHPEILNKIKSLNWVAFQSVKYKTVADFQACYRNEDLPKVQRTNCYGSLIYKEVEASNFTKVLTHEKDFKRLVKTEKANNMYYLQKDINRVRAYVNLDDSIRKLDLSADTMAFKRAMALNKIGAVSIFCHGCGGCDPSLVINALEEFNKNYPNSLLIDNSIFALIGYKNPMQLPEDYNLEAGKKEYQIFKLKYPNSDKVTDADFQILSMHLHKREEKYKIGLLEKFEEFKKLHPDYEFIERINYGIKELKRGI